MQLNGFETPNKIIVFVKDNNIEYSAKMPISNYKKLSFASMAFHTDSYEDEMEKAKKEAAKAIPSDATLDYQEVTKILDEELNPILAVKTVCVDEQEGRFVLGYEYSLK